VTHGAARSGGRVGIFFVESVLDSVPSLCDLASLLARAGLLVDIFTLANPDNPLPTFESRNVTVHILTGESLILSRHRRTEDAVTVRPHPDRRAASPSIAGGFARVRRIVVDFFKDALNAALLSKTLRLHRAHPFACFIGVEPVGLSRAALHSRVLRVPLVYYSLELLLSSEVCTPDESRRKARERVNSRQATRILVQDDERARLLAADNGLSIDRFLTLPNAPLGPSSRVRERWWHEKYRLPASSRVLLYAGGLWPGTCVDEIVDSASALPPDWVLVVHTRSNSTLSPLVERARSRDGSGRVFFSTTPVHRQVYDRLVASADIGVAFYTPVEGVAILGTNLTSIGLASGKVAYYLRAGLPVIVNDATSLAAFVRGGRCGEVVAIAAEIPGAITRISSNYDELSRNACARFDAQLDLAPSGDRVVRALTQIADHGRGTQKR
jgi:glycosyltransferase involved in cell wall biosynthesis